MTWLNPWAWLGLAVLAAPILIHLLGRRRPVRLQFPTLRFLGASRQLPARRRRIHDVPLLLVRLAVLALAVAALAQPRISRWRATASATVARAIVVDASDSMSRGTATGGTAIEAARTRAETIARESATARIFETTDPRAAVPPATAWLTEQPFRRELVLVSDFQNGTIDRSDFAGIRADVGIRFEAIEAQRPETADGADVTRGTQVLRPSLRLDANATAVEWRPVATSGGRAPGILTLGAPGDEAGLNAVIESASAEGVPATTGTRPVAVVFSGAPEAARLAASASAVDQQWMFDVIDSVARDAAATSLAARLRSATRATSPDRPASISLPHRIVEGPGEAPLVSAGAAEVEGRRGVILFVPTTVAEEPVFAAAVLRAAWRAAGDPESMRELEPNRISDDELTAWSRPPAADPAAAPLSGDRTNGRWLWAFALVVLGIETWMRRSKVERAATEEPRARVA